MKVLITGGGGFLGKKLARRILEGAELIGPSGRPEKVRELVLFDVAKASGPGLDDPRVHALAGDIANFATVQSIVQGASSVFHFAAVVSAGAEADFDLGYKVNLDGTRNVLEACRAQGSTPRLIFTSSLAAYGGELPPAVTDDTPLTPQTSYGAQKAIGEFLVRDYTRKGYLRGTAVRLPTICVRTGAPNKAASTWASSMVREPLTGVDVICPVTPQTVMAVLSPRRTVEAFVRAHNLEVDAFGPGRALLLNGINVTARELEEGMRRNAGNRRVGKVTWQHDPMIQRICDGWPQGIDSARARRLGFETDRDLDEIVRHFIADDLDEQMKLVSRAA
ncbi:MAG: NAD-dependent epimerase/dehydratase family protein [Alphaproteobacteria bacterium]|nr:NAD-dependent epimerase/dehydratase family protein [Alphaproteobacteria bacterium]